MRDFIFANSEFYKNINEGYWPADFDQLELPIQYKRVTKTGQHEKGYGIFLWHVESKQVQYIEENLIKFLLEHKNYLQQSGSKHCMAILDKIEKRGVPMYYCANSTIRGNAKTLEHIEVHRDDIQLHKLRVEPLNLKDPSCILKPCNIPNTSKAFDGYNMNSKNHN